MFFCLFSHVPLSCRKSRPLSHPSLRLIFVHLLKFFFEKLVLYEQLKEEEEKNYSRRTKEKKFIKKRKRGFASYHYVVDR
jgi:hypothetical protein